jgi:hypothetical protein
MIIIHVVNNQGVATVASAGSRPYRRRTGGKAERFIHEPRRALGGDRLSKQCGPGF